jgi:hypothetical protein
LRHSNKRYSHPEENHTQNAHESPG